MLEVGKEPAMIDYIPAQSGEFMPVWEMLLWGFVAFAVSALLF